MAADIEPGEIVPESDPRTHCKSCNLGAHRELLHMLWLCPQAKEIWQWVQLMLSCAGDLPPDFELSAAQALLGAEVKVRGHHFPLKLWELLRGQACWEIWKARDKMVYEKEQITT
jgi:hypothetical protein